MSIATQTTATTTATITRAELVEAMHYLRGARIVTLHTEVEPAIKSPKKSGMAGRIRKRSKINCIINFHYSNAVNNQREREAAPLMEHPLVRAGVATIEVEHFEALPRKWGVRIDGTPLITHKGEWYLETKVERVYDTQYFLDGTPVEREAVANYLQEKREEGGRQGVEKKIILRDYKISSLVAITTGGKTYLIEN